MTLSNDDVQFVITAPEEYSSLVSYENSLRQTHGVLIDMIKDAESYIVLSAPYLKDLQLSNKYLNLALKNALKRDVTVNIISTRKSIKAANIKQYEGRINLYTTQVNQKNFKLIGLHAKFCIVDGKSVYLGSANFTFYGLNQHFEMGVYSNGLLAKQVENFWLYLKNRNHLVDCTDKYL